MYVLKIEHFHKQSTRGEYVLRNGEVTPNVFCLHFPVQVVERKSTQFNGHALRSRMNKTEKERY